MKTKDFKLEGADGSIDSMNDEELISFLDERYNSMKSATIRTQQEQEWNDADKGFTAVAVYDNYGSLQVNLPLEQDLIDTYEGRASGKYNFDVQPDGKQADVNELQPAKYSLDFYLENGYGDGNGFYDEAPIMRRSKARYGTLFSFVGLDNDVQLKYRLKNGKKEILDKDSYEPYIVDSWTFFPKHLNIRSVFVDEKALGQSLIQKAEDAIIEKQISIDKIRLEWGNNKQYKNIDKLQVSGVDDTIKQNPKTYSITETTVRFYYNKLTKDYIVYSSDDHVILHKSKMIYNHGKLPIESCQHYSNENSLYGIGICKKIAYLKAYKTEILQSILNNAAMSAGLNFIIGNNGEVENFNVGGGDINTWRTTVGAEQIKPVQPQINSGLIAILDILDDLVVQDTGEDIKGQINMQSDKVGIVEIMEENKMVRHKSVDENWNLFLDRTMTMMLSNIAQFVPALESETIEVDGTEIIKYPRILVKHATVEKDRKGKIKINTVDNYGKLGYFEFKPGLIPAGLGVKVVTPSSHNALPLIAKDNFERYQEAKLRLLEMASQDVTGQKTKEVLDTIDILEVNDWMQDVYGFDNKLKSLTNKDKIKQKNLQLREQLLKMTESLQTNTQLDGQNPGEAMTGSPKKTPKFKQGEGVQNPAVEGGSGGVQEVMGGMPQGL